MQWIQKGLGLSALAMASIGLAGCSVFGNNGEVNEPDYRVLVQDKTYEVRQYDPMVLAQVSTRGEWDKASRQGFRPLFEYIDGANRAQKKVPMTQPVLQQQASGEKIPMTAPVLMRADTEAQQWTMSFVLPQEFTLDSAPRPLNPEVEIVAQPSRKLAVVQFNGVADAELRREKGEELISWASQQGFTPVGTPFYAGYNPPFTLPPFRRNEMLLEVK